MHKPSPAMVVALIALFVALSGSALANSGLILGSSIKNGTIAASKLTPNAVKFLKGQRGLPGPQGASGVDGATGPTGATGPAGGFNPASVQYIVSAPVGIAAGSVGAATAACPAGTIPIGGGAFTDGLSIWDTRPVTGGWFAGGHAYDSLPGNITAWAVCAGP